MKRDLRILCTLNAPIYNLYQYSQIYSWTNDTKRDKAEPVAEETSASEWNVPNNFFTNLTATWMEGSSKYNDGFLCVFNSTQFILSEDSVKIITLHSGY